MIGFGRFLEHSRIYIFKYADHSEVYLASADLMPRNLSRRVELLFPILDHRIHDQIMNLYHLMWTDNVQTLVLQPDDTWKHVHVGKHTKRISYQETCVNDRRRIAKRLYKHRWL